MAMNYDPNDPTSLYQPWPDANTGMNGQPWGQPQPIDPNQGMSQMSAANNPVMPASGNTGINGGSQFGYNPYAGQGGSLSQQPNWQGASVTPDQISGYFASRGVTPYASTPDYWQKQWGSLYNRGQELQNPNYAFQRLQFADEFLGGDPTKSPFYEAPAQSSGSAYGSGGTSQIASVNPSATAGTVSPTYTAMLSNGSAYGNNKAGSGIQTAMDQNNKGLTLAQLIGMGGR